MEQHVFKTYPAVKQLRDALLIQGAAYASMSGSGSSVFGLFKEEPELRDTWQRPPFRSWILRF